MDFRLPDILEPPPRRPSRYGLPGSWDQLTDVIIEGGLALIEELDAHRHKRVFDEAKCIQNILETSETTEDVYNDLRVSLQFVITCYQGTSTAIADDVYNEYMDAMVKAIERVRGFWGAVLLCEPSESHALKTLAHMRTTSVNRARTMAHAALLVYEYAVRRYEVFGDKTWENHGPEWRWFGDDLAIRASGYDNNVLPDLVLMRETPHIWRLRMLRYITDESRHDDKWVPVQAEPDRLIIGNDVPEEVRALVTHALIR